MTYTDEDVQRLVTNVRRWDVYPSSIIWEEVMNSLKPFLPDPEQELLTEMTIAFDKQWGNGSWDKETENYKKERIKCMAAALAIVKERGLPQ